MTSFIDTIDAFALMKESRFHKNWQTEDVYNYILTPMGLNQYLLLRDSKGDPISFCTWACPTDLEVEFYQKMQRFPINGFKSKGKNVWIIDFISKKGYTLKGVRFVWNYFNQKNVYDIRWVRLEKLKIGWIKSKG